MISIPCLCRRLKQLFEEEAVQLARACGLRQRDLPLSTLAYILVLGWWSHPQEGQSALARFAGQFGMTLSKQLIDAHLHERSATWLLALLQRAVQWMVCAQAVCVPLLQQFTAVVIEDGSSISLPSALKELWCGSGGNTQQGTPRKDPKTEAAIKLTLRWDLLRGGLDGPYLQAGKTHELRSVLQEHPLQQGSLWCADLGYWLLVRLAQFMREGVFFLIRYKVGIVLWMDGHRVDLLSVLPQTVNATVEYLVDVGAKRQVRQVRLLAQRVPEAVVQQREARYREYARVHQKAVNPQVLALSQWTILLTNVPAQRLSLAQAFALMYARWQIELLFKLWKQTLCLEQWNGTRPMRVLCEVYAKLLAVVVQHWFVLLACWHDPDRSGELVAHVIQEHVSLLVHGVTGHLPLPRVVRLIVESVRGQCSIPPRSTRPSTSRLLQGALAPGLP